jgi:23S rRNA pseudoU1915 N3-methylase RlmH
MNFWWKFAALATAIIGVFFGGTHYQSLVDSRKAAALVQEQRDANAKAQAELDKKAEIAERALAAERAKSADLADQWEKERHAKSHTVCILSAGSISLLKAASK